MRRKGRLECLPITAFHNTFDQRFSKFHLIKTFRRSTMTNERLTNLVMMSIENETVKTKIRYDCVDKNGCIFENLENGNFLV